MLALVPALSPSNLERHICASSVRHGHGRDAHSNISTTIHFVLISLKVFRFPVYLSDPLWPYAPISPPRVTHKHRKSPLQSKAPPLPATPSHSHAAATPSHSLLPPSHSQPSLPVTSELHPKVYLWAPTLRRNIAHQSFNWNEPGSTASQISMTHQGSMRRLNLLACSWRGSCLGRSRCRGRGTSSPLTPSAAWVPLELPCCACCVATQHSVLHARTSPQLCAPSFPALQQPTFMMAASMRLLSDCSAAVQSLWGGRG